MTPEEAFKEITEITDGSCFHSRGLRFPENKEIGLDGYFTAEKLKAIAAIIEDIG
jgi:hypothetical protein